MTASRDSYGRARASYGKTAADDGCIRRGFRIFVRIIDFIMLSRTPVAMLAMVNKIKYNGILFAVRHGVFSKRIFIENTLTYRGPTHIGPFKILTAH